MKLEYLPTEDEKDWCVFAYVNNQKNEVEWTAVNSTSRYMDGVLGTEFSQFQVWRRKKVVIVEAVGWFDSDFHFRVELTDEPDRVIILAEAMAGMMENALE